MGLRLQRHLGPVGTIDPGQYAVDKPCVFVSCPICGTIEDISVSHQISVGGVVTPRYACRRCPFLDFLSLDCWNEEPRS
jgi:hypothetical protein